MACKLLSLAALLPAAFICLDPEAALGRAQSEMPSARSILQWSVADQTEFINSTIEQGFPESRADQMTMLIINRSHLTISLILANLEDGLSMESASPRFVATAVEMIAYAGDEESLQAISRLMRIDEERFGWLVGRTLGNAANWRNPFTLAYRAFDLADAKLSRRVAEWSEEILKDAGPKKQWAKAILERYGRLPDDSEWAKDPIASRLKDSRTAEFRLQMNGLLRQSMNQRDK
jgi:hypothetical protein